MSNTLNGVCRNAMCRVKFAIIALPAEMSIVAKAGMAAICPKCGHRKIALDTSNKPVDIGLCQDQGYLRFSGETCLRGPTYRLAFPPIASLLDGENTRWREVYGLDKNKASMDMTIRYDKDEYEEGCILDIALPVRLFADGSVAIFEDEKRRTLLAYYTASDMFQAHGLTF